MGKHAVDGNLDADLLRNTSSSMHCFVADAASDEMRAAARLSGSSVVQTLWPDLPNMNVVVRVKAHAARRRVSRLCKAYPYFDTVNQRYIWVGKEHGEDVRDSPHVQEHVTRIVSQM